VPLATQYSVMRNALLAAAAGWNAGFDAAGRRQGAEHQGCTFVVAHLTFGEQHDERAALAISDAVQLGGQAALGTPNTTGNSPF
jgi:hypothetical protein